MEASALRLLPRVGQDMTEPPPVPTGESGIVVRPRVDECPHNRLARAELDAIEAILRGLDG